MTEYRSEFLRLAAARGQLHQCTDAAGLDALMEKERVTAYIGFDCTAPSFHVGSLVQIMTLRRLQQTGHKPIVVMGGGKPFGSRNLVCAAIRLGKRKREARRQAPIEERRVRSRRVRHGQRGEPVGPELDPAHRIGLPRPTHLVARVSGVAAPHSIRLVVTEADPSLPADRNRLQAVGCLPVVASQSRAVRSALAVRMVLPSGANATALTTP